MDANREARIAAIASCQQCVFSRAQALAVGFDDSAILRRLGSGRWVLERPGVYGLPGMPDSWSRQLWIAFLSVGADAVVSFQSASAIRRLQGFFPGPLILTAPHGGHDRLPGGFVHQISFLAAVEAGGLPAPIRQLQLPGRGVIAGLVDAGYPDVKLLMETDGRRWHTRVKDIGRDHLRDAEAARAGWQTLRFLYEHVMDDPGEVCATIRDVRAARATLGLNSRT